jgi:hypothetical protein
MTTSVLIVRPLDVVMLSHGGDFRDLTQTTDRSAARCGLCWLASLEAPAYSAMGMYAGAINGFPG